MNKADLALIGAAGLAIATGYGIVKGTEACVNGGKKVAKKIKVKVDNHKEKKLHEITDETESDQDNCEK